MSGKDDIRIINPLALVTAAAWLATSARDARADCGEYADAPTCSTEDDVCGGTGCGDVYRGCSPGGQDCADNPLGNPDDRCCAGYSSIAGTSATRRRRAGSRQRVAVFVRDPGVRGK
jgi:hypothetical protein